MYICIIHIFISLLVLIIVWEVLDRISSQGGRGHIALACFFFLEGGRFFFGGTRLVGFVCCFCFSRIIVKNQTIDNQQVL